VASAAAVGNTSYPNIPIEGDKPYCDRIVTCLRTIAPVSVGKKLIDSIGKAGKAVSINPFSGIKCGVTASANSIDVTTKDGPIFDGDRNNAIKTKMRSGIIRNENF